MPIQQGNVQQQAVVANLSAADHIAENLKEQVLRGAKDTSKTKPAESLTKQLLEATGRQKGTPILSDLLSKLGETFTPKKISNKLNQEYGSILEEKEEDFSDKVDLKYLKSQGTKSAKSKLVQKAKQDAGLLQKEPEVREYLKSYTSFLVNGSSEVKKEVDKLEQKLLKEGKIKVKDLNSFRSKAAKSVRGEVLKQIKSAFYKELFAQGKLEQAFAKHGTQKALDWAFFNKKIGGYDFGGEHGSLEGAKDEAVAQVKQETQDYVQDELSKTFAKKHLAEGEGKDLKNVEKEIGNLLKLAAKSGFNIEGFVKNIPKMMDEQGMLPVINYEMAPGASMDQGDERGREYQYNPDEEKDILMEKLRVLYMKRAIFGDWKTSLEVSVRMVRTKNGLVKLGLKMDDFSQLQKEGKELAKLKLVQMLREAFEERATYGKLSGPAWKMTEKKIKTIFRNLVKLGLKFDDNNIGYLRDKANQKMFAEAEHELNIIESALEVRETAYLMSKRKTVLLILERLSEESDIPWNRDKVNNLSIAT